MDDERKATALTQIQTSLYRLLTANLLRFCGRQSDFRFRWKLAGSLPSQQVLKCNTKDAEET